MNAMPSIGTSIAPSQNKLKYFLFFNEVGNILPLKNNIQPHRLLDCCKHSEDIQFR
jgi:hypothetical protein